MTAFFALLLFNNILRELRVLLAKIIIKTNKLALKAN